MKFLVACAHVLMSSIKGRHNVLPYSLPEEGGLDTMEKKVRNTLVKGVLLRGFASVFSTLTSTGREWGNASLATVMVLLGALLLSGCDAKPPELQLATAKEKAEQCVEPSEDMRRNHMVYLDVHRDKTVIEGIRTKKHSLNECINCHVAKTKADGEALHYPDKEHFCASCHTYAGVKIDCFQCHADRPQDMDYQHKLSADSYHKLAANKDEPSIADMLVVTGAAEVAQ